MYWTREGYTKGNEAGHRPLHLRMYPCLVSACSQLLPCDVCSAVLPPFDQTSWCDRLGVCLWCYLPQIWSCLVSRVTYPGVGVDQTHCLAGIAQLVLAP